MGEGYQIGKLTRTSITERKVVFPGQKVIKRGSGKGMLNIKNNTGKIPISRTSKKKKIGKELDRLDQLLMIHLFESKRKHDLLF